MNIDHLLSQLPASRAQSDDELRIARSLRKYYPELDDDSASVDPRRFSVARLLQTHAGIRKADGYETEFLSAQATVAGQRYPDPNRPFIPWAALGRGLATTSPAYKGGYLVGVETQSPVEVLRPYSVVAQAGLQVLPNLRDNVALPALTGLPSGKWVHDAPDGGLYGVEVDPNITLYQPSLTAKMAMVTVKFSIQLLRQAPEATEMLVRTLLLQTVGEMLDKAALGGAGGSEPLGLMRTTGVGLQAGGSLAHAGLLEMRRGVLAAGAREDGITWIGTPTVQATLGARERSSGGGRFLWDGNEILGRPANASKLAPTGTLVCGDFSQAYLGIWGPGPMLAIDPTQDFVSAGLVARVILLCDVAYVRPDAFTVATSVT